MKNTKSSTKNTFTIEDLHKVRLVASPLLSPDGKYLLYAVTVIDRAANERREELYLRQIHENSTKKIGYGSPHCWSPDSSKILIESEDADLFIYNLRSEEKKKLVELNHSNHFINHLEQKNAAWSPDGKYIAYLSARQSDLEYEENVRVINTLSYKSKGGNGRLPFSDDNLTHICIIPASGGETNVLTEGDHIEHSISWSPDSKHIAFISNRSPKPENNQYLDIWNVDIETKETKRLTNDRKTTFCPSWSPDGKYIAFLQTSSIISTNDSAADDTHIAIIPSDGGDSRLLTKTMDRRTEFYRWHPRSEKIFFTAGDHGDTAIYSILLATGKVEIIIDERSCIPEFSISANGEDFAYVKSQTDVPPEIFITQHNRSQTLQVTHENEELKELSLQPSETFWVRSFDETPVQGWLIKPVDFKESNKYPLILIIHGGPHNMYGNEFDVQMQLLANAGYGILFMNPRGSHGYGQAFSNGNTLNWGGGDYKDLMLGLDEIITHNTWVDEDRLGVTGQSYGGYMTNWIITQTDRFKAAVSDGGISNLISFSGTSLYHSLMESEFKGEIYENYSLLWQWSPIRNIANVKTPTLVLHGETDNEVPLSQADEMFVGLIKQGVETTYVQYIGEGHGWRPDLRPKNREDLHIRILEWFKKYV